MMGGMLGRVLMAAGAGLALADASIVTLALPPVLDALDTSVEGVAAVIGVYTLVLAVALPFAARLLRGWGARRLGVLGFGLFALASLGCGAASSLPVLLALRGIQALGAAAGLVSTFSLLGAGEAGTAGRRLWVAAAIFGTAVGPALGGALTELLDWRAIFLAQAPLALAAAVACAGASDRPHREPVAETSPSLASRAPLALALLSAALTAVLFLVVLLLVSGWSVSPLAAAAAVSVLPVAALAGARIPGEARPRAAAGCLLLGAGVLCLALLPWASPWWTLAPQLIAGLGMGLALPALSGELLPERSPRDAARLLSLRHAGITLALLALAPVVASDLDGALSDAREQGAAVILDAPLAPVAKLELAPRLVSVLETREDPRGELERAFAAEQEASGGAEGAELERLEGRLDDVVVLAVDQAFSVALVLTAGLALLAGILLRPSLLAPGAAATAAATLAVLGGYVVADRSSGPEPVAIANPCEARAAPGTGGIDGAIQDTALVLLDQAACRYGSSREELVLALADEEAARDFEADHGVDPRSAGGILQGLLGG